MGWFENMQASAGLLRPESADRESTTVVPQHAPVSPPTREAGEAKPAKEQHEVEMPLLPTSYGAMMLSLNEVQADLIVGTKGQAKADGPCGGCVEAIAEQLMGR